tara:strand:+ start:1002 stop:1187 length:186 start_codon:yes stop_codon:yes gene_type:complete
MKIYRLVICYNEEDEQLEYIEESIEDDQAPEHTYMGSIDLTEYFEDYPEMLVYLTGEVGEA